MIVDALAATVGADKKAALNCLETVSFCRERDLPTVCGLSNISFGLPERGFVNAAFLAMAIQQGLTLAIANPMQDLLMNVAGASDLLMNRAGSDLAYIRRMQAVRCPAGISHPMVGLLARRLTGKYLAPETEHLKVRVEEINHGAYDELIEQIMQKPITEMQELYNNREIEK